METEQYPDLVTAAIVHVCANIGKPWIRGAQGPDAFDCGGLTRTCQREVFGRDLPIILMDTMDALQVARTIAKHPLYRSWTRVALAGARHGDVVTLARHDHPSHVGTYLEIDRGGLWHTMEGAGAMFDPLFVLPAMGWHSLTFHRPVDGIEVRP